ncbi:MULTISPECIES: hypothetical protein [Ralstonia]|uniref:hypothetical protein n=1 Tax=Ralstonia TaxID=48736 RepID=UPI0011143359|nr:MULTISPECIES: hypothetical protein [Ralstonia]
MAPSTTGSRSGSPLLVVTQHRPWCAQGFCTVQRCRGLTACGACRRAIAAQAAIPAHPIACSCRDMRAGGRLATHLSAGSAIKKELIAAILPIHLKEHSPFFLVFSSFFSRYAIDIEIIFSRGNRLPPSRKWRSHEEKPAQDSDSSTRFFRANIQNRVLF